MRAKSMVPKQNTRQAIATLPIAAPMVITSFRCTRGIAWIAAISSAKKRSLLN